MTEKHTQKRPAFTLIELIIAIGILMILLVIGLMQYETYNRRNNLILTTDSVKSFIESAKNNARGQGSDLPVDVNYSQISLEISSNKKNLNEYRISENNEKIQADSLAVGNKITLDIINPTTSQVLTGATLAIIDIPEGIFIKEPSPPYSLKLSSGGETSIVNLSDNAITTSFSF